jgi:curved DNA-binding protein CbpA
MRLNRAGEIDYYEELGVERNAAPEAIRDAFRALVRLLHPDQQTDEHLKSIAEMQMRKVNRIYAVLSDPERRRRYDEMLDEDFLPPAIVFNPAATNLTPKALMTRMAWIGAAMLGVAVVIWVATDPPAGPSFGAPERPAAAAHPSSANPQPVSRNEAAGLAESQNTSEAQSAPATGAVSNPASSQDEVARLKAELRAARFERDEAKRELIRLKGPGEAVEHASAPSAPASAPLTSAATSMADLAPPRLVPAPPRTPAAGLSSAASNAATRTVRLPGSDPHQFAGFWFFARNTQPKNKNLYPPEFIEAVLTEQNGVVHGKYRSRYQIVDRAISPDVNFEFSGSPAGPVISCLWNGPGGARGQLTVHMTDENSIRVDWSASEMGSVQGLASGTATLTRRLE